MHKRYQELLKEYQINPILLPQVQEMIGQVFERPSQDHEQDEKRLKLQPTELEHTNTKVKRRGYTFL